MLKSLSYTSLQRLTYINSCDILYKYNLNSLEKLPKIKKIVLELPVNAILNFDNSDEDFTTILIKSYLSMFFITSRLPYLNCNKFKNMDKVTNRNTNFQYVFKLTKNNKHEILLLLSNLFIDNNKLNNNLHIQSNINTDKIKFFSTYNFILNCQSSRMLEYRDILNNIFSSKELSKIKFRFNIILSNLSNNMVSSNEFKNFIFLWNI